MSIALEGNASGQILLPRFIRVMPFFAPGTNSRFTGDREVPVDREDESGSCSSPSLGGDGDVSGGGPSDGDDEVESSCRGGPLNSMSALMMFFANQELGSWVLSEVKNGG